MCETCAREVNIDLREFSCQVDPMLSGVGLEADIEKFDVSGVVSGWYLASTQLHLFGFKEKARCVQLDPARTPSLGLSCVCC